MVSLEGKNAKVAINVPSLEGSRKLSFLHDISPILTQKGCTGSNCHGSVRGKADFKLSLFGARPDMDFDEVVKGDGGRRINRDKPEESLLLRKPTFQEAHGGGERFKSNPWSIRPSSNGFPVVSNMTLVVQDSKRSPFIPGKNSRGCGIATAFDRHWPPF